MGIFVITPTYVIFADHILFSVSHITSSNNKSSHTLCVSSTEPVIKKFSTAWHTIHLHGTVECGLFLQNFKTIFTLCILCKSAANEQDMINSINFTYAQRPFELHFQIRYV